MRNLLQIIVGGSGAGKTRYVVKPNIMQANASYIVTDPKGSWHGHHPLLLKKGYTVQVLDLIDRPFRFLQSFSYIRKGFRCVPAHRQFHQKHHAKERPAE